MQPGQNNGSPAPDKPSSLAGGNFAGGGANMQPQISIGSVLSRSLAILMKNPLLYLVLAVLAVVPGVILQTTMPMSVDPQTATTASVLGPQLIVAILNAILSMVIQGAIVYAVFQSLSGQRAEIGSAISRGLARIVPLLLASILVGLATGIGMLLFIIPGIIIMCICAVTIPACVLEKLGAVESISRSAALTKNNRMRIFGLLVIVNVVIYILIMIVSAMAVSIGSQAVFIVIMVIALTIPQAFNCIMLAIIYCDLRVIKEGANIDALARVFD